MYLYRYINRNDRSPTAYLAKLLNAADCGFMQSGTRDVFSCSAINLCISSETDNEYSRVNACWLSVAIVIYLYDDERERRWNRRMVYRLVSLGGHAASCPWRNLFGCRIECGTVDRLFALYCALSHAERAARCRHVPGNITLGNR